MKWLEKQAFNQPNHLFLNEYSFSDLYKSVQERANQLDSLVSEKSRIAIISENSQDMVACLFALLGLSKEVLLLNTQLSNQEIQEQLSQLEVEAVITSDAIKNKCSPSWSFSDIKKLTSTNQVNLTQEFPDDKIAIIMNTSATSGQFKSVPITWGMISKHVQASQEVLGVEKEDNWLLALPLFHVSGLSILMRSLYNGRAITLLEKFQDQEVLKLINSGKVNMISLVPTLLNRIIDHIADNELRLILLGGEFIPKTLIDSCLAKKLPIYKTYGMTEHFSQATTFNVLDFPEKSQSVGRPLPEVTIRIQQADETGIGQIALISPMLMSAYLGQASYGQTFETGDIGYLDDDGFLYVLNRRQDLIISGGENIYPKEVEDLLYSLPQIKECALVAKEDARWGQIPLLFVVGQVTEKEIRKLLVSKLAKYKQPHAIYFRNELPKNASGKIIRKELKP